MAESQKKSKAGRKPKYDYKSEEFLALVESYAKKACASGIAPQRFCEKKSGFTESAEVLTQVHQRRGVQRTSGTSIVIRLS